MAAARGTQVPLLTLQARPRTFAESLLQTPQAIPEVSIPFWQPKYVDGEFFVHFTQEEVDRSAVPFRFPMVLNF